MQFLFKNFLPNVITDNTRPYLDSFFPGRYVIFTDSDFAFVSHLKWADSVAVMKKIVADYDIDQIIIDLTHNPYPTRGQDVIQAYQEFSEIKPTVVLTCDYYYYYHPIKNYFYFPLWLWSFSVKLPWLHRSPDDLFETVGNKTKSMMCLNRQPRYHRILLTQALQQREIIHKIDYCFSCIPDGSSTFNYGDLTRKEIEKFEQFKTKLPWLLPGETKQSRLNDISVKHTVYSQCAANLVTETWIDHCFTSEKTSKPFIARQIPVLFGSVGLNAHLHDLGLDMFEDIVPWRTWDNILDIRDKTNRIADFVTDWLQKDTVLDTWYQVQDRIERNYQYFVSEEFQRRMLLQMPKV